MTTMVLPPVDWISDDVLEMRALKLLVEHEQRKGKILSLPVPVEKIVSATLGLAIEWTDDFDRWESDGGTVLACIDPSCRAEPTVFMNARHQQHFETYFGTEAFSLAHEGAHWDLHLHRGAVAQQLSFDPITVAPPVLCRQLGSHDRREIQAEKFAAYLLLPEHLVRPTIVGLDLARRSVFAGLARRCGVSKTALRKRLVQLDAIVVGPENQIAMPKPAARGSMI
jgi:hypothetical protein